MFVWLLALIYCSYALEYPALKRGGDVCICEGFGVQTSSYCTPAVLRNKPYDSTTLSSSIDDITSSSSESAFVVQSGSILPRIVLEVVSESEQILAESQSDVSNLFGVSVFSLLGAEINFNSIEVVGKSPQSIDIDLEFSRPLAFSGTVVLDDVRVSARGLAPWDSVSVILNLSLAISRSATTSSNPVLWIVLPAVSVRMTPAVGNSTHSLIPLVLRFPVFGGALRQRYMASVGLFDSDSITLGVPLPEIVIFVTNIFGNLVNLQGASITLRAMFSSGVAVSTIRGDVVAHVTNGRATFKNITFDESTPPRVGVYFVFECDDARVSSLRSSLLTTLPVAVFNYRLSFSEDSVPYDPSLFVYGPVSPWLERTAGSELPALRVRVLDSSGAVDRNTPRGLFIIASSREAPLFEWSSKRPVINGEAIFEGISFKPLHRGEFVNAVLTFTPSDLQDFSASTANARRILRSPLVRVFANSSSNLSFLEFQADSFFSRAAVASKYTVVVSNKTLPRIQLILRRGGGLRSIISEPIRVEFHEPRAGLDIEGHNGLFLADNTASLCDIRIIDPFACSTYNFTACEPVQLRFSVSGSYIISPPFYVVDEVLPQASVRFEPSSRSLLTTPGQYLFATAQVPLAPIAIEILRSDGSVDTDANDVIVRVTSSMLSIEGSTSISIRGRVIFNHLTFAESGTDSLVFTASTRHGPISLQSGTIHVEASPVPLYALEFLPESTIHGAPFFASAGYRLSPIGLVVLSSDGGRSNSSFVVRAICSSFCVGETTMTSQNGQVWFTNLTFPQISESPRIVFELVPTEYLNLRAGAAIISVLDGTQLMFGRSLSTGPITFVASTSLLEMRVAPFFSSEGLLLRAPPPGATELISDTSSPVSVYRKSTSHLRSLSVALQAYNGAQQLIIPNSTVVVTCDSNPPSTGNISSFQVADSENRVNFFDMAFGDIEAITGFFTSLTFSSPSFRNPLRIGPVHFEGFEPGGFNFEPILLVEVLSDGASFAIDSWTRNLASLMGIQKERIEILRVRRGSSAPSGFEREWVGTRIELRFLTPTTSSLSKASSEELANNFLSLATDDCGVVSPLRIRRKLMVHDDTHCDLYDLDEQRRAAQRCVETSGPSGRCSCHVPMFEVLGDRCKTTDQMLSLCATLNRCGEYEAISTPCFELTFLIYLQYFLIGVYTSLFVISVYVVYLWRTGFFSRCRRRAFRDAVDGKAPPLKEESEIFQHQHLDLLL